MTALTYSGLVTSVNNFFEKTYDTLFQAELPRLIQLAERRAGRANKVLGFTKAAVATMAANNGVLTLPDLWRETISINYGTGTGNNTRVFLLPRSYEYCRTVYPDQTVTAAPLYYASYDYNHILVSPTPDQNYPFEINYYSLPDLLTTSNQTNWWTEYAPEVLRAAVYYECAMWLKDDALSAKWGQEYATAIAALNGEDQEKAVDREATRRRP